MTLSDLIRREADSWSRQAALVAKPADDFPRHVATILRRIAGVTEVHGLAGLHGYLSCLNYSHSVADVPTRAVKDVIARILNGEAH